LIRLVASSVVGALVVAASRLGAEPVEPPVGVYYWEPERMAAAKSALDAGGKGEDF
jgi:hypothetical protein